MFGSDDKNGNISQAWLWSYELSPVILHNLQTRSWLAFFLAKPDYEPLGAPEITIAKFACSSSKEQVDHTGL